jgi:HPr kinase/phosphorylase
LAKQVNLADLIRQHGETLQVKQLNSEISLDRDIITVEINRPGLELIGYWDFFVPDRIQVFGNKEMAFLTTRSDEDLHNMIERFFQLNVPCVFFANGLEPPDLMLQLAETYETPLFSSQLVATELTARMSEFLNLDLAPSTTFHGSMVDVYGVGMLITGRSGIGKSEVALDLIERGHRLVADDVVRVRVASTNVLVGSGHELLEHHLEVRGVGIVDVRRLFGIRNIRAQKRLEVIVKLIEWDENENYDRIGAEEKFMEILGIKIPLVTLPIFPGKNITVIAEVIALNQLLRIYGEFPAKEFQEHLMEKLQEQSKLREYLSRDFE